MIKLEIKYRENDNGAGTSRIKRLKGETLKDALLKLTRELYVCEIDEDEMESAEQILDEIEEAQQNNFEDYEGDLDVISYIKDGDTNEVYYKCEDEIIDDDNEW